MLFPVNIRDGIECWDAYQDLIQGKRVGIVANHTSRVDTIHSVDFLLKKGINVVRIFARSTVFEERQMREKRWGIM